MTWEEWATAAGVAKFDSYGFLPYTVSDTKHIAGSDCSPQGRIRLERSKRRRYWYRGERIFAVTRSVRHYPKKVHDAWKNGEDPSEWLPGKVLDK